MDITTIRNLSTVPRWGIVHTIQSQTVADHSYQVAMASLMIEDFLNTGADRANLMWWALHHDIHEAATGDIPSPAKKMGGVDIDVWEIAVDEKFDIKWPDQPSDNVKNIVLLADLFECCCFLYEEQRLGNKGVSVICHNIRNYIKYRCTEHFDLNLFDHLDIQFSKIYHFKGMFS